MAFIRKRGRSFYLVHNVREKGHVRQIHLACLGRRPHISDDVIRGVSSKHPFVRVDWSDLREKASQQLIQPFENNAEYLHELISEIRNVDMDIAALHLPVLQLSAGQEVAAELTSAMKLLRATLEVKLGPARKGRTPGLSNLTPGGMPWERKPS